MSALALTRAQKQHISDRGHTHCNHCENAEPLNVSRGPTPANQFTLNIRFQEVIRFEAPQTLYLGLVPSWACRHPFQTGASRCLLAATFGLPNTLIKRKEISNKDMFCDYWWSSENAKADFPCTIMLYDWVHLFESLLQCRFIEAYQWLYKNLACYLVTSAEIWVMHRASPTMIFDPGLRKYAITLQIMITPPHLLWFDFRIWSRHDIIFKSGQHPPKHINRLP